MAAVAADGATAESAEGNDATRLKAEGNAAYTAERYESAEACYSAALDAEGCDRTMQVALLGNRSAARCALERYEDALSDAVRALAIDPSWVKGYHRKAVAQLALGQPNEAVETYEQATELAPENEGLKQQLHRARKRARDHNRRSRIRGLNHWLSIFSGIDDMRMHLGVMATFWNAATASERLSIFRRFLGIIAGNSGQTADGSKSRDLEVLQATYTEDGMQELPLDNYSDLDIPEAWIAYFTALEGPQKIQYFEAMFNSLDEQEKTLVVHDLKFFFSAPV